MASKKYEVVLKDGSVLEAFGEPQRYSRGQAIKKAKAFGGKIRFVEHKGEPLAECDICGKELYDGDKGYATTEGMTTEDFGGFGASDMEPWDYTACENCGNRISAAAGLIAGTPEKYTPEVLKAAPELLDVLQEAYRQFFELQKTHGAHVPWNATTLHRMKAAIDAAMKKGE